MDVEKNEGESCKTKNNQIKNKYIWKNLGVGTTKEQVEGKYSRCFDHVK